MLSGGGNGSSFRENGKVRLIVTQLSQFAACDELAATIIGREALVGRWRGVRIISN